MEPLRLVEPLASESPVLKRRHQTPDGEVECAYTVPMFDGIKATTGQAVTVDKDDWREPGDATAWLIREADPGSGEMHDREIVAVQLGEHGEFWAQLLPDDGDGYRSDYLTGRIDKQYQLVDVEMRRGRYNVVPVVRFETAAQPEIEPASEIGQRALVLVAVA